ncbi:hypothetical protein BDF14DRAFT_1867249 [Spinellus fusiger]|nr:hypothetical protein BDF14DRAFT_1867249 [Spinellus fusiger]
MIRALPIYILFYFPTKASSLAVINEAKTSWLCLYKNILSSLGHWLSTHTHTDTFTYV